MILYSDPNIGVGLTLRLAWTEVLMVSAKTKTEGEIERLSIEVRDMLSWTSVD